MTFSPCRGENLDLHNIFTTHVGIFMTKFTPHVVKIDFHYKIYTTFTPLRIDRDIDENVQFCLKQRVVTPCCDHLEKLTLLCEGLKTIG